MENKIPEQIFIVTYRDRAVQKEVFINHMSKILEKNNYLILFVHQNDKRLFNKGALMNIGFIYTKEKYPKMYQTINFIFHDIDIMPAFENQISYKTENGSVEHHYGFKHSIGGIYTFRGKDYETINGTPNFWGWGWEDNAVNLRLKNNNIKIAKNSFFNKKNPKTLNELIEIKTSKNRTFNFSNTENHLKEIKNNNSLKYGISSLKNINYDVQEITKNIKMIHVNHFDTQIKMPTFSYTQAPPKTFKQYKLIENRNKKTKEKIKNKTNSSKLFNMRIFQN